MASKDPLAASVARIERDESRQSKYDAHRDKRIAKTQERRDKVSAHLDKHEQRRTDALKRVQSARENALERAGVANHPAVLSSEEKLQKHLDKTEQRRVDALKRVQDKRAKAESKYDEQLARVESRGKDVREKRTNERELRHFNRDHRKEMRAPDHIESAKEAHLRRTREAGAVAEAENETLFSNSDVELLGADEDEEMPDITPPKPSVGVFTVKTSSED